MPQEVTKTQTASGGASKPPVIIDPADHGRFEFDDKAKSAGVRVWHFFRFCLWVFGLLCLIAIILAVVGIYHLAT